MNPMALTATEQNRIKKKGRERDEVSESKIIKKKKKIANKQCHKWLGTIVKIHFSSRKAHPLEAIFWACVLYLGLF